MRFLADMGISPKIADLLRSRGHQATHLQEEGLYRLTDPDILEKARKEKCIVLTHDLDFGDLIAASGADLPSVLIFRLRNMRPENVNQYLLKVISQYSESLENGAIIIVMEGRIRSFHSRSADRQKNMGSIKTGTSTLAVEQGLRFKSGLPDHGFQRGYDLGRNPFFQSQ